MKKRASLNSVKQKATGQNRCQAKGCVKLGSAKFVGQMVLLHLHGAFSLAERCRQKIHRKNSRNLRAE